MNFHHPFAFDEEKSEANYEKHGLRFTDFTGFDNQPVVVPDKRQDYGEPRFRAFGRIGNIGYTIAYTERAGRGRMSNFRRCREKEMQRYERRADGS